MSVKKFEEEYPNLSEEFKRIQQRQYELFASKMLDYGISNIALGSNLEDFEDTKVSLMGVWFRMMDKINRTKHLLLKNQTPHVKSESIQDTFQDLTNYSIIAQLLLEEKWKK